MGTMTLVSGDDWSGIYIDGKLTAQGHSFSTRQIAELTIVHRVLKFEQKSADMDWLSDRGDLPDDLSEVEMEAWPPKQK